MIHEIGENKRHQMPAALVIKIGTTDCLSIPEDSASDLGRREPVCPHLSPFGYATGDQAGRATGPEAMDQITEMSACRIASSCARL